jgi:hypothetical protein
MGLEQLNTLRQSDSNTQRQRAEKKTEGEKERLLIWAMESRMGIRAIEDGNTVALRLLYIDVLEGVVGTIVGDEETSVLAIEGETIAARDGDETRVDENTEETSDESDKVSDKVSGEAGGKGV